VDDFLRLVIKTLLKNMMSSCSHCMEPLRFRGCTARIFSGEKYGHKGRKEPHLIYERINQKITLYTSTFFKEKSVEKIPAATICKPSSSNLIPDVISLCTECKTPLKSGNYTRQNIVIII